MLKPKIRLASKRIQERLGGVAWECRIPETRCYGGYGRTPSVAYAEWTDRMRERAVRSRASKAGWARRKQTAFESGVLSRQLGALHSIRLPELPSPTVEIEPYI